MADDPFHLERFVEAQADTYDRAIAELRGGRKHSHWMWFIFPQLRALGRSSAAQFYGIASLNEAKAYLTHQILGSRLDQATHTVLATDGSSVRQIFGVPDDLKFHSSMTLFALASPLADDPFREALYRWFAGEMDGATLQILSGRRRLDR